MKLDYFLITFLIMIFFAQGKKAPSNSKIWKKLQKLDSFVKVYLHSHILKLVKPPSLKSLKVILNPDFSTPTFNPKPFNPRLFNRELFNPRLFNHEFLNHGVEKVMVEMSGVEKLLLA